MPWTMPPTTWPCDEQRVDDRARVVDRREAEDPQDAGRALDLDDRRVRAGRHRDVGREARWAWSGSGAAAAISASVMSRPAARARACAAISSAASATAEPPIDERPRAERADPGGRLGAVAEVQLDLVQPDPEAVGGDLGERRVVPLAVRRGARPDDDPAVALDA